MDAQQDSFHGGGGKRRRGNDDAEDYYNQVAARKAAAKRSKRDLYDGSVANAPSSFVADDLEDGARRKTNWQIDANKGLTPKRPKEQRNSRVKHRKKYAKKMKDIMFAM